MDEPNTATAEQAILESFPEERAAKRIRVDSPADDGKPSVEQAAISVNGTQPDGTKEAEDDKASGPTEEKPSAEESKSDSIDGRVKGLAPIKKEYLIPRSSSTATSTIIDDDAAEARGSTAQAERRDDRDSGPKKEGRKKSKGQNTERSFGRSEDALMLCNTRALAPELSPRECRFGDRCKMSHDLRKYLKEGRREDVGTFDGQCPVFEQHGHCPSGWKCRFVKSHMKEIEHDDGRHELVLIDNRPGKLDKTHHAEIDAEESDERMEANDGKDESDDRPGVYNVVSKSDKIQLGRRRIDFAKANEYIQWLNHETGLNTDFHNRRKAQSQEGIEDLRAQFVDPPFMPSEKRRLYFGPETPTLAPLTTQGNLPFRRLCVELGCQLTYSEMAYSMPLLNGVKADWALMKAHESEISPPKIGPAAVPMFDDYDNSRDLKFGAQIEGSAPWVVTKAVDALNRYCPHLRLIDLNCGCPIDKVFKGGAGSALLDATGKMERMIRGMNAMSGEIPITAKLRTGIRGNRPVATQIIGRLAFGSREHRERLGAPGCAAVTLHGRSREQRYTKTADWAYIGECAALIKSYNSEKAALTDTAAEPDARTLPNARDGRMYFLGNGDCFSHVDYHEHVDKARVDSVMIGRGALIKPWIFEEIEKGQYLDKSSGERLRYVEKFARYGLEAWGSDELGIGFTRRFLLEWLSFAHRYVPVGILEHLPPRLNDRPPAFRGRDDMETLMASENYKDWIKITEMFLGPAHPNFQFQPKHKSNSYETEG